jgi:DNA-binding MarR family transcriptional regulator
MLDSLEKDGLVKRSPDPADRRTKRLELTKQGETVLEEIFGVADELRARLVEDLSARDADRMNTLLKGLIDKLDTGLPDPD